MCGIVGIAGVMPVNQSIYDALTVLQHRGQDAAGIITIDANNCFRLRKANGLVSDVFEARHMQRMQGNMGIGHVRYPTAGSSSASEAQPFYVNSPYGITLAHNGNLTNAHELRKSCLKRSGVTSIPPQILKSCSISSPVSWITSATTRWKQTTFSPRLPRPTARSAARMPAWR